MTFPSVRFVRTTHGLTDKSKIVSDVSLEQFQPLGPKGPAFSIMDVRPEVPADNLHPPDPTSFKNNLPWAPATGFSVYVLDMPGGYKQFTMHRTLSVDYVYILSGEISLVLDVNQVLLRAGDCVQIQGADHRWMNNAPAPCRILCFSAAAKELIPSHGKQDGSS